jgi:perosamine synthetase
LWRPGGARPDACGSFERLRSTPLKSALAGRPGSWRFAVTGSPASLELLVRITEDAVYVAADPLLTRAALFSPDIPDEESLLRQQIPYGAPFYARGRIALWAVLRSMRVGPGQDVLLPSFICDSVLGPIEAVGANTRFYPTGRILEIDADRIRSSLTPGTSAVVVPHYYGAPTPMEEILALCNERGIWLIEDCAHALFSFAGSTPLGRQGHAAVFSPWKSLPVPDGGILTLNDSRLVRPDPLPEHGAFSLAANIVYRVLPSIETVIGRSPRVRLLSRRDVRDSIQDRDRSPDFRREMGSNFSYQMLERADGKLIRDRRRANFDRLAKAVASQPYLQAALPTLPDGMCPLGLPVLCLDREHARRHFLDRGINVRAYWERLPREVTKAEFPDAHTLSHKILILPVHQSLTEKQTEHIASAIATLTQGAFR